MNEHDQCMQLKLFLNQDIVTSEYFNIDYMELISIPNVTALKMGVTCSMKNF